MSGNQSLAARARWDALTPAERRAAVEPAIRTSLDRRRLAGALLAAVESAGLVVSIPDAEEEP